MGSLRNSVIIITGAAQGLGESIARTLAREKPILILLDKQTEKLNKLSEEFAGLGLRTMPVSLDLCDGEKIQKTATEAAEKYGRIDVLINNAGTDVTKPVISLKTEEWDRVIDVNLRAPFIFAKSVIPFMIRQGSGHIVNIASTAAKRAWPNAAAYHASKWGLLGLGEALLTECRQHRIKITTVIAGGMETSFLSERFPNIDPDTLQEPAHVAETMRFLLKQPAKTVIAEITVLPRLETSWP